MMDIYTSYYANPIFKSNLKDTFYFIRISCSKPEWFHVNDSISEFYPPYKLVDLMKSGIVSEDKYISTYRAILDNLDCVSVLNKHIKGINKDIALLCWESPIEFCHRHILADKLNDYGYSIKELDN